MFPAWVAILLTVILFCNTFIETIKPNRHSSIQIQAFNAPAHTNNTGRDTYCFQLHEDLLIHSLIQEQFPHLVDHILNHSLIQFRLQGSSYRRKHLCYKTATCYGRHLNVAKQIRVKTSPCNHYANRSCGTLKCALVAVIRAEFDNILPTASPCQMA